MAIDKLVDSAQLNADLTSVANAIRARSGGSGSLSFPAGFVSEIGNIPTGGEVSGTKQITINQNGTVTENVASYANAEITVNVSGGSGESDWDAYAQGTWPSGDAVLSDSITSLTVSNFKGLTNLTSIVANGLTAIPADAFNGCKKLVRGIFHSCTTMGSTCFRSAGMNGAAGTGLWVFPKITALTGDSFRQARINIMDLGPDCASLATRTFYQPTYGGYIDTLILRKTDAVVTAANSDAIQKIGSSTKVYVPSALIDSYKAATNWSTKGDVFYPLEGSEYESVYADGTPISE